MTRDFFSILKEKTGLNPSKEFDNRFWANFDSVVPSRSLLARKTQRRWRLLFPIATAGAATLALLFFLNFEKRKSTEIAETQNAYAVLANAELLKDIDLFSTFDELPIDDEEWKILLGEG